MEGNIQHIFQKVGNQLTKCSIQELKTRDRVNFKKPEGKK